MAKMDQMIDILRVDGIMAQGYGLNPKMVMRDKRLTPEAKCIYSYLASFAGGGNQAFPSRDIMMDELQMSKTRYYKHLKYLVDADYVRIERTKQGGGAFDKNIYTLVTLPNPIAKEENKVNSVEKPAGSAEENNQSAGSQKKAGIKNLQVKERASVNELRKQLEIDNLKLSDPNNADIIEDVFMAIEDMNASEQITVSGNIKKKEAIQELINQLTSDHIRHVSKILSKNNKALTNRKAYIQACVINSIFDLRNQNIEAQKAITESGKILEAESEKEKERIIQEAERQEAYRNYPELKDIDEQMTEQMKKLSRTVLLKDEVTSQKLKNQVQQLQERRNAFIESKGLTATI